MHTAFWTWEYQEELKDVKKGQRYGFQPPVRTEPSLHGGKVSKIAS
jgi:hypothetical protein